MAGWVLFWIWRQPGWNVPALLGAALTPILAAGAAKAVAIGLARRALKAEVRRLLAAAC